MENKLEQLFYVALGGALAAKEQIEKNSEELKSWQDKAETSGRTFLDDLAEKGSCASAGHSAAIASSAFWSRCFCCFAASNAGCYGSHCRRRRS